MNDELRRTIDLAEAYAAKYDGDDRQDVKTDVLNAFYAGAEFGKKLTEQKIREAFESLYVRSKQASQRNEHGDYVLPSIQDAWAGWKAAFEAGGLAERNRCRYPQCVENEDERCLRWLAGECEGPSTE